MNNNTTKGTIYVFTGEHGQALNGDYIYPTAAYIGEIIGHSQDLIWIKTTAGETYIFPVSSVQKIKINE